LPRFVLAMDAGDHDELEVPVDLLSSKERLVAQVISELPILDKDSIPLDDSCPICLSSFDSLIAEDRDDNVGVTKLNGCGHIFCMKDLTEWIRSFHGSCPTCRNSFLDIRPPSDSDDESSDGGEWIPDEHEEDEDEDAFLDTDDFSETGEFDAEQMELDLEDIWDMEDNEMDWGLTDGDSESFSEGMSSTNLEEGTDEHTLQMDVSVSIHEDEEPEGDGFSDPITTNEPK